MNILYYGHSCIGITINGIYLLIDPFITPNPKAAHLDIASIKADYILITHAHYDHILDVEFFAQRDQSMIISNHEIVQYYDRLGIKGHAMNPGGSFSFPFGTLKVVQAIHSSSFPDGTYGGNPCGFIIESNGKTIYIAGDTALSMDMKLIPMFHQLDLAVLPIGGNYTMDVNEAVVAADFLQCNKILGVHYDTAELITIDHEKAQEKFANHGKELILLEIGADLDV